ncbi:disulfide oxidoreductase [Viridibacillus arvi]|uniref:disulfide oxidoreductase n=1 Tax=Viridibacillus arvi TaxID=263475 RepID=UPI003D069646
MKKSEINLLFSAWLISIFATIGSLYFSEVLHYKPCNLCWYQRIVMYPLTLLFGIAIIKKHQWISYYSMFLSVIGILFSAYQYLYSFFPTDIVSCGSASCKEEYINIFGFITIPLLSLTSFIIIFIISFILNRNLKKHVN